MYDIYICTYVSIHTYADSKCRYTHSTLTHSTLTHSTVVVRLYILPLRKLIGNSCENSSVLLQIGIQKLNFFTPYCRYST